MFARLATKKEQNASLSQAKTINLHQAKIDYLYDLRGHIKSDSLSSLFVSSKPCINAGHTLGSARSDLKHVNIRYLRDRPLSGMRFLHLVLEYMDVGSLDGVVASPRLLPSSGHQRNGRK